MKKIAGNIIVQIFLIVIMFFGTTISAWAVDLAPYVDNYVRKRYFSNPHVNIDFEQVTGFIEQVNSEGILTGLLIMQKNGSSTLLTDSGVGHLTTISRAYIAPAFSAFKEARENLLITATQDLSSVIKLEMVFK